MPIKHRPPRHKGEVVRPFDQRETPARQIDAAAINALHLLARRCLSERQGELLRQPLRCRQQLALAQLFDRAAGQPKTLIPFCSQSLRHEPTATLPLRREHLGAEPGLSRG